MVGSKFGIVVFEAEDKLSSRLRNEAELEDVTIESCHDDKTLSEVASKGSEVRRIAVMEIDVGVTHCVNAIRRFSGMFDGVLVIGSEDERLLEPFLRELGVASICVCDADAASVLRKSRRLIKS